MKDLVEKEANIWACIYRGINRKKENNEYDEEEDNSESLIYSNTLSDVNLQFLQSKTASFSRSVTETGTSLESLF